MLNVRFSSHFVLIMSSVITYVEGCCPHKTRKFNVWDVSKSLRPSHVLCNILGYCHPTVPTRDTQYKLLSRVQKYEDLWYFLNILHLVSIAKDIPSRMYNDVTSVCRYMNFCESLHDTLCEKVRHFVAPGGAAKQLDLYTHWDTFTDLGNIFLKNGISKTDIIAAFEGFARCNPGYGRHAYAASMGEMFMQKKFSPDWYRLQRRHKTIMKRVDEIRAENGSVAIWETEMCR